MKYDFTGHIRPLLFYGEGACFSETFSSFDKITALTYVLIRSATNIAFSKMVRKTSLNNKPNLHKIYPSLLTSILA